MIVQSIAAWLVTVFLHLGLAVGLAHVLTARLDSGIWRERLWRLALCGALVTAGAQTFAGSGPLVWRVASQGASVPDVIEPQGEPVQLVAPGWEGANTSAAFAPSAEPPQPAMGSAAESARSSSGDLVSVAVVGAWLLIALGVSLREALRSRRFVTGLARRRLSGRADLRRSLDDLRPLAQRRLKLRLSVSAALRSPVVLSGREICLPARVLEEFSPRELEATLAHELAHVLRRDPLWLRIYAAFEALFFFQPLVRRATGALRAEAELACDDWAVRRGADPIGLARSLASIAAWQPQTPVALSAMVAGPSGLMRRVSRLTTDGGSGATRARIALSCAALVIGLGAFACGGPGVSTEVAVLELDEAGAPETLRIELVEAGRASAEGETWELPAQDQELRDFLERRNGVDESLGWNELSDLRVVIDVAEDVRFARVQNLMQTLASQRIWRIEFAADSGPNLAVPLPHDLGELDVPIEEPAVGSVVDGVVVAIDEDGQRVPVENARIVLAAPRPQRVEVVLRVQSQNPRVIQYSLGADSTTSVEELEGLARRAHERHELRTVVIDARPGIVYQDVVSTIDALVLAGLTDVQLVFVGAYGE